MGPRRIIRPDIAASVVAHLSLLILLFLAGEVHPFSSVTTETIAVDLVAPDEVKDKPAPAQPDPAPPKPDMASQAKSASEQLAAAPPQQQAALSPPDPREAAARPQSPSVAGAAAPAYTPPEPDLTLKYHVILGLPEALPPARSSDGPGNGFDAPASATANIASSLVAEFRRHLKTCLKLPASISPEEKVFIKLRVLMTPEGRLAAEPVVVEGTATSKALDLKESAVTALEACQPYAMLPVDRYGEWKELDLNFTPQDFLGPS